MGKKKFTKLKSYFDNDEELKKLSAQLRPLQQKIEERDASKIKFVKELRLKGDLGDLIYEKIKPLTKYDVTQEKLDDVSKSFLESLDYAGIELLEEEDIPKKTYKAIEKEIKEDQKILKLIEELKEFNRPNPSPEIIIKPVEAIIISEQKQDKFIKPIKE